MVRIRGFMYPLEAGETHRYFLLSALPPELPVLPSGERAGARRGEVRRRGSATPLEPVLLEGRFELLEEDDALGTGLHYRLNNARSGELTLSGAARGADPPRAPMRAPNRPPERAPRGGFQRRSLSTAATFEAVRRERRAPRTRQGR